MRAANPICHLVVRKKMITAIGMDSIMAVNADICRGDKFLVGNIKRTITQISTNYSN